MTYLDLMYECTIAKALVDNSINFGENPRREIKALDKLVRTAEKKAKAESSYILVVNKYRPILEDYKTKY